MAWLRKPIRGILMDITGVLYESGERKAIEGSVDALRMLRTADIPFRFITNETQKTKEQLDSALHRLGFDIYEKEMFMCVPAAKKFIHDLNYRPFLLVHPNVEAEFAECDQNEPNCVVVGDAASNFSYENMNRAFHVLVDNDDSVLITLGKGKYYKEEGKMTMDVGPFTAALEYATDRHAIVIGKPGEEFFRLALEDMKLRPEDVVMIGDDLVCDVGGAQSAGMRGVLVRTGKFRATDGLLTQLRFAIATASMMSLTLSLGPEDENHPSIRPDAIVKNLLDAIERILSTERPTKQVLPE